MKKAPPSVLPEHTVADLAHFAWCGLVALRTVQQDGQAASPLAAHTFLLRWLAVAQKQKRFPRAIAPDIAGLLALGRNKGIAANLINRLEYLAHFSHREKRYERATSSTFPIPPASINKPHLSKK